MSHRSGPFDRDARARAGPRLDGARLVQRPIAWLNPNRLVTACRIALVVLLAIALIVGPESGGSIVLRFAIAYGVTIFAIPAFPRSGGRHVGGTVALLFSARWAFGTLGVATPVMLLTQLAGVVCALAPVYARNVGGLAGPTEGHISFTERRAMWRHRSAGGAMPPTPRTTPQQAPGSSTTALLDYRPESGS